MCNEKNLSRNEILNYRRETEIPGTRLGLFRFKQQARVVVFNHFHPYVILYHSTKYRVKKNSFEVFQKVPNISGDSKRNIETKLMTCDAKSTRGTELKIIITSDARRGSTF